MTTTVPKINDVNAAILAGKVNRFHTTPSQRLQTVGEHSYGVALWVHYLYKGAPPAYALMRALTHDMTELYTGDMPAQTKWEFPKLSEILNDVEHKILKDKHPCYAELCIDEFPIQTEIEQQRYASYIVHIADKLELLSECVHEITLGNAYNFTVFQRVFDYLDSDFSQIPNTSPFIGDTRRILSWFLTQTNNALTVPNDFSKWRAKMWTIYCEPEPPMENRGSDAVA